MWKREEIQTLLWRGLTQAPSNLTCTPSLSAIGVSILCRKAADQFCWLNADAGSTYRSSDRWGSSLSDQALTFKISPHGSTLVW